MKNLSRTVWVLSLISLFTDMASEMLYPVMPLFLRQIGYGVIFIGVLEGCAEAVAGLTKGYFGRQSDLSGKRLPFVQVGYTLSALSKPLMIFFIYPIWIFICRTTDRLGKGIRTGARDALLRDESTAENRGRIFGFHRSMDTLGAAIGPGIALIYLYFNPGDFKTLFLIAFLPGVLAIVCSRLIKEKKQEPLSVARSNSLFGFLHYWKESDEQYRRLVIGLLFFALFNSSDVFLLLKIREAGLSDTAVIAVYIFYNLIYALLAYPIGLMADKIGLKKIFIIGLILFSVVYAGFALSADLYIYLILFAVYGIYAAATEGISKAWISNIVHKKDSATAIGSYSGYQSIASLIASSLTGILWFYAGGKITFLITAIAVMMLVLYFIQLPKPNNIEK